MCSLRQLYGSSSFLYRSASLWHFLLNVCMCLYIGSLGRRSVSHSIHFHVLQFWWSAIFMSVIFSAPSTERIRRYMQTDKSSTCTTNADTDIETPESSTRTESAEATASPLRRHPRPSTSAIRQQTHFTEEFPSWRFSGVFAGSRVRVTKLPAYMNNVMWRFCLHLCFFRPLIFVVWLQIT